MQIRPAEEKDVPQILSLLKQVNEIHYNGRPDIFKKATKYTSQQLKSILTDKNRPILVADDGKVVGYAFCVFEQHICDNLLTDIKTLYIDDLCVDEKSRGQHIGSALYDAVVAFAKSSGGYNITLNVWNLNQSALKFYQKVGMKPLKIYMEQIIE